MLFELVQIVICFFVTARFTENCFCVRVISAILFPSLCSTVVNARRCSQFEYLESILRSQLRLFIKTRQFFIKTRDKRYRIPFKPIAARSWWAPHTIRRSSPSMPFATGGARKGVSVTPRHRTTHFWPTVAAATARVVGFGNMRCKKNWLIPTNWR